MQESLKRHCQDEENAGSGRHGQADIFFLHRNGDESTPEVSLHRDFLIDGWCIGTFFFETF